MCGGRVISTVQKSLCPGYHGAWGDSIDTFRIMSVNVYIRYQRLITTYKATNAQITLVTYMYAALIKSEHRSAAYGSIFVSQLAQVARSFWQFPRCTTHHFSGILVLHNASSLQATLTSTFITVMFVAQKNNSRVAATMLLNSMSSLLSDS